MNRLAIVLVFLAGCQTQDAPEPTEDPVSVFPGEIVDVRLDLGPWTELIGYEVRFGEVTAAFVEPIIDYENDSRVVGVSVIVPVGAASGPVEVISYTSDGGRSVQSASPFEIQDLAAEVVVPDFRQAALDGLVRRPGGGTPDFIRLGPPNFTSEEANSKDVVIADFDSDGDPDVFVPQTGTTGEVLYENIGNDTAGLPMFTVHANVVTNDLNSKRQYGARSVDLDNDGDLDVVPSGAEQSVDQSSDGVRLLMNDGTGRFTNEAPSRVSGLDSLLGSAFNWDDVAVGDIDGDGDSDIALSNRSTTGTRSAYLENDGLGSFTAHPNAFGEPTDDVHHDVVFCDLNGDSLPEVVLSQDMRGPERPLRILFNNGPSASPQFTDISGTFSPNHHSEHLGCVDLNNDGKLDLHAGVWERSDRDRASERYREDLILLNDSVDSDGSGAVEADEVSLSLVAEPEVGGGLMSGFDTQIYSAAYGDFDSDGLVDIVLGAMAQLNAKGPFLMKNEGNGKFTNISPANAYWRDLSNTTFDHFNPTSPSVADLNNDGLLDIVFGLGDGMNGPSDEANRIYIQRRNRARIDPCELFNLPRCRPIDIPEMRPGRVVVPPIRPGEIGIDPLPRNCLVKFDCPGCGGPFERCAGQFDIIVDLEPFVEAGIEMDVALVNREGRLAEPVRLDDGRMSLSFRPERFNEFGVDQDVALVFECKSGEPQEVEVAVGIEFKSDG